MITQNDNDEVAQPAAKLTKVSVDHVQWVARLGFEDGFKASGADGNWFDAWAVSKTRQLLVDNGMIEKEVTYR